MSPQITALDTALLRVPTGTWWAGFGVSELEVVHVTVTDGEGGTGTGFTFSINGWTSPSGPDQPKRATSDYEKAGRCLSYLRRHPLHLVAPSPDRSA
jgi:hypothetical protein